MIDLTAETFEQTTKGAIPMLVDFSAEWCMPCKIYTPVLEELSTEMNGRIAFGKLDVSNFDEIASQYSITGIPTVVLFKNGNEIGRLEGVQQRGVLKAMLDASITS